MLTRLTTDVEIHKSIPIDLTGAGYTEADVKTAWDAAAVILKAHVNDMADEIEAGYSAALTEDKTVYVHPAGNDTTGDGSDSAPYATFAKAVSVFPKNLNGHAAKIAVGLDSAATFSEGITLSDFYGGKFALVIYSGKTVSYIVADNTTVVLESANPASALAGQLTCGYIKATNGAKILPDLTYTVKTISISYGDSNGRGVSALNDSTVILTPSSVNISNTTNAVYADNSSKIYASVLAGVGHTVGLSSKDGSEISYGTSTLSAAMAEEKINGGQIYTGP